MHRESLYKRFKPAAGPAENNHEPGYWLAFSSSNLLIKAENSRFSLPFLSKLDDLRISGIRQQYLGTFENVPCYSAELPPDIAAPEGFSFIGLRPLYFGVDEDIFLLAGRAMQIMHWHQTHQFCGRCGHTTETHQTDWAKICPACQFISYPRISPAVIVAVLKQDQILLTRYSQFRGNMHTIIAGFLEPGETLEECVHREVLEEVGLTVKNIQYFGSQPWPFPNSLMIGFTAEFAGGELRPDGTEIVEAGWYSADNTPVIPPKMSISREIIDWFIDKHSHKG